MSAVSPYPGLRSFDRDEADVFFGRDRCLDGMAQTLQDTRFLAVLGPSGSGKSSLVRSGLFMHLEAGLAPKAGSRWTFLDIRHPRTQPFRELALATLQCEGDRQSETAGEAEHRSESAGLEPGDADLDARRKALRMGPLALVRWWREHPHHPNENLLILIDQFEELFGYTTPRQRDEVEAFVDLLLHTAGNDELDIYVVLTMRSEFLGGCALFPGLAEQINRSLSLTPRMTRDECRMAITGPAYGEALTLEPLLVTTLLNDMNSLARFDEPSAGEDAGGGEAATAELRQTDLIARRADQLPLMQHVLNWMWTLAAARRSDPDEPILLSLQDYLALGGLRGALSRHAHEVMESTGEPELTSRIFRALTEQPTVATSGSAESSAVRRRRTLAELAEETGAGEDRVRAVVDSFRAEGVSMLTPDPTVRLTGDVEVDIAHESLIRQWSDLRGWIRDEAEGGRAWQELLRDVGKGKQIRGLDLAERRGWWQRAAPHAGWAARYGGEFETVDASLKADLRAERRRKVMLRAGTGGLVAMAAVSLFTLSEARGRQKSADKEAIRVAIESRHAAKLAQERSLSLVTKAHTESARALAAADHARIEAEAARQEQAATLAGAKAVSAAAARGMALASAEIDRANQASEKILARSQNLSEHLRKQEYAHLQLVWEKSPAEASESFEGSGKLAKMLEANDADAFARLQPELEKASGDFAAYRLATKEMVTLASGTMADVARTDGGAVRTGRGALRLIQAETLMGRAAHFEGRSDAAQAAFARAAALMPSDRSDELRLARAEAEYESASALLDEGMTARAAGAAARCLEAAPEVVTDQESTVERVEKFSIEEQRLLRPAFVRSRCHSILSAVAATGEEAEIQWRQANELLHRSAFNSVDVALARADLIARWLRRRGTTSAPGLPEELVMLIEGDLDDFVQTRRFDSGGKVPAIQPAAVYPLVALHRIAAYNEYARWFIHQESDVDLARIKAILNVTKAMFRTIPFVTDVTTVKAVSDAYDRLAANLIALEDLAGPDTYDSLDEVFGIAPQAIQENFLVLGRLGSDGETLGRIHRLQAQALELVRVGRRHRNWQRYGALRSEGEDLMRLICGRPGIVDDQACAALEREFTEIASEDAALARSVAARAPRAGRAAGPFLADASGFAMDGFDPVVCFERGGGFARRRATANPSQIRGSGAAGAEPPEPLRQCSPRKGRLEYALSWGGGVWLFESEENRRLFLDSKGLQAPRLGGYPLERIAFGHRDTEGGPIQSGVLFGDRLYLTRDGFAQLQMWLSPEMLAQAEAAWARLKDAPDPAPLETHPAKETP